MGLVLASWLPPQDGPERERLAGPPQRHAHRLSGLVAFQRFMEVMQVSDRLAVYRGDDVVRLQPRLRGRAVRLDADDKSAALDWKPVGVGHLRSQAHRVQSQRGADHPARGDERRSEEHTSELQSLAYLVC